MLLPVYCSALIKLASVTIKEALIWTIVNIHCSGFSAASETQNIPFQLWLNITLNDEVLVMPPLEIFWLSLSLFSSIDNI